MATDEVQRELPLPFPQTLRGQTLSTTRITFSPALLKPRVQWPCARLSEAKRRGLIEACK